MQTISIDISDSGRILIEDRVFYYSNNDIEGMIENTNTNERALLKKYDDPAVIDSIEAFEYDVLSLVGNSRCLKNVVYPRVFRQKNAKIDGDEFYVFTEIPANCSGNNIHQLSKSFSVNGFSIYSRIMAAINLSETLSVLQNYVGKNILSIHPEDIYINIENGDVYIWIEQWLGNITELDKVDDFGFSPEWYSRENHTFDMEDFRFFAAYAIFRLLCNDEPFDGSETLIQFPLLTAEAVRSMHADRYGFILAKGDNAVSEYIGQGLWKKWRALPTFIRNEFEKNFTVGIGFREERTDIAKWLKIMQKMRDCLVYVNGQFKFCDPDVSNQVLFMIIDDYKIPVWPKKAIYWYHVGIELNESKNGIVAGVTAKDGHYYLNNLSGNVWGATLNNTSLWVYPESDVEIIEGMTIQLENKKIIRIVNGQIDGPKKPVDVTVQDLKDVVDNIVPDECDVSLDVQETDVQTAVESADSDSEGKEE